MKKINDLINLSRISQDFQEPSEKIYQADEKVISRLFAVLMIQYSHKWASQFPDEETTTAMKKVWGRGLSKITNDQIKAALDKTIDMYPSWPPTLGEFKALCKVGEEAKRLEQLSLPKPKLPKEERCRLADQYLAGLKI